MAAIVNSGGSELLNAGATLAREVQVKINIACSNDNSSAALTIQYGYKMGTMETRRSDEVDTASKRQS